MRYSSKGYEPCDKNPAGRVIQLTVKFKAKPLYLGYSLLYSGGCGKKGVSFVSGKKDSQSKKQKRTKEISKNWWTQRRTPRFRFVIKKSGGGKKMSRDKKIIIAHYFMKKSREAGRKDLSNKKLQKLMYYAQAWSLVLNNKKIVDDKFEAWIHGAAIKDLYGRYKKYGWNDIDEEFDDAEFKKLDEKDKELLDEVWEVYGKYDADYLEVLNHSEEPWQKARQNVPSFKSSSAVISEEDMKRYYGRRLKEAKA